MGFLKSKLNTILIGITSRKGRQLAYIHVCMCVLICMCLIERMNKPL